MVQTDIPQISRECNSWREKLRQFKEEITGYKTKLQEVASHSLSKNDMTGVEHFQNQFHIQLINVHDLKQAIKMHDRKLQFAPATNQDDGLVMDHESLHDQYQTQEHTLQDLRSDFNQFIRSVSLH
ncbi:MAG TPA: hypothetical protein VIQ00_12445 [Chitinophagaceae bacterium]|jgi:hypothetical protein